MGLDGCLHKMEITFNVPRLRFESLLVRFLPSGKILVVPEGRGFHFTLHPGHKSGKIDVHRTNEGVPDGDPSKYETLTTIAKKDIVDKLQQMGMGHIHELLGLLRPIRLGWIARRCLGIVAFPTDAELSSVSAFRIKSTPAENAEFLRCWMRMPEFIDEILELPNEAFLLFDCKKVSSPPYGVLLRLKDSRGGVRLLWARFSDLLRWSARLEIQLAEIFSGSALAAIPNLLR
ncbi:MAG TPA: hypothetical protein VJP02_12120 [Candidatus Sulfotelmatobacter sp.]|nr:hypothetical protein [Candidatus Sulfotelmatobacter sp.]